MHGPNVSSQPFVLNIHGKLTSVYCHMGNFGCGNGGWTTIMKIDGIKSTFHFDSAYWKDQNESNPLGGETGFDSQESKLRTYWSTPFNKICLGMKIGQKTTFIVLNKQANSLYSLIADGVDRATAVGRETWKSLIGSQASLQDNCNREGFNVASDRSDMSKARIGILGNNENDCITCDSRIGFGTGGKHNNHVSCGNNGIKTMCYILVQ